MTPCISLIYIYYNTPQEIYNSVVSLNRAFGPISHEIIIIDNASPKPLPKNILRDTTLRIITNKENKGYGKALNQGVKIAKGAYVLFSNPDTIYLKDSINLMQKKMASDLTIGIIGPQFLDSEKQISPTGNGMPFLPDALFVFSFLGKLFPHNLFTKRYLLHGLSRDREQEFPVICGASMLMSKNLFDKIHGFDERFFMYFEESDLCYRIRKEGYKVLYYPVAKVIHLGGKSSDNKLWIRHTFEESRLKFFKKYHNVFIATLAEIFLRTANSIMHLL